MTKITQIDDKSAVVAWSSISSHPDYLALGTKDSGGIGFDDYGGELDLYDLNLSCPDGSAPTPRLMGSVKTNNRFSSIGWTTGSGAVTDRFHMGLVAGGMMDGIVHIWNPQLLLKNEESALVASINQHEGGAVKALKFNGLVPNELATGGSDGQVLITSLDTPNLPVVTLPGTEPSKGAQVTQLAWNSQVAHIVASAASDGIVSVWDLKSKRPWCRLQAESSGISVSDVAWNPSQGLHMITASADDRNPILKVWDLRASTTMPLATLSGHSQGILSLAWCPHDDTLLLTCGKDNRTILWDLHALKPIADIPIDEPAPTSMEQQNQGSSSDVFSSTAGLSSSQQRRYDVQWSPLKRGVVSTCSLDRKVQAHSVIGLATQCGRPPKWLKPSSGVSCAFGASVVSFSSTDKIVKITSAVEQPELVQASGEFEAAMADGNTIGFCQSMAAKAEQAGDTDEAQIWGFMQVIFEENAREQLLGHLGFDAESIAEAAREFSEDLNGGMGSMSLDEQATAPMSKPAGEAVKKALLVGNFEAAVECCFRTGNLADALILASCGGAELWERTQERYFQSEEKKRPFLSLVNAIIQNKLGGLVASSDPSRWQETLAILSTYGPSDEFPSLCIALGDRLEESGDEKNASLCHMCSLSLDRAVKHWRSQLEVAINVKGGMDFLALHEFVVKVTVFLKAIDPSTSLDPEVGELFSTYAAALAEQGLLVTAAQYCKGESEASRILRDKLYRSRESPRCLQALGSAPEFPFSISAVNNAPSKASNTAAQSTLPRSYAQRRSLPQQQQSSATFASKQNETTYPSQQPSQATADELPAGWIALQDPSSGQTYYANQSTGETTWERPQVPSSAQTAPVAGYRPQEATVQVAQQQQQQQYQQTNGSTAPAPARLVSKYGDGFVTSSSHPELGQQYGNVGTSNPYSHSRPGIAKVSPADKAPDSGNFDPNSMPELTPDLAPIKDGLLEIVAALMSAAVTGAEKRMLIEGEKGVTVLLKKLSRNQVSSEIAGQVANMVKALQAKDYASATAVQAALVNHDWHDHKDWLKGIKFINQLAAKKLAT